MERLFEELNSVEVSESRQALAKLYLQIGMIHGSDDTLVLKAIIPKCHKLFQLGKLRKDILYLSLMAPENYPLLNAFIAHEKNDFSMDPKDPVSLYNWCMHFNSSWLLKLLSTSQANDEWRRQWSTTIFNVLTVLKSIQICRFIDTSTDNANSDIIIYQLETVLNSIKNANHHTNEILQAIHEEIQYYVTVRKHLNNVCTIQFVPNLLLLEVTSKCSNFLQVLSICLNISERKHWQRISEKLLEIDGELAACFHCFMILSIVIDCVPNSAHSHTAISNLIVDQVITGLLQINSRQLQMETAENLLALIFFRDSRTNQFVCGEQELHSILYIVKTVLVEMQPQQNSGVHRLHCLRKTLADINWRLELISSVKSGATFADEGQLLNYMLSNADSLIYQCLKQANFDGAFQVIELFQLKQSPITRQVQFAEKYQYFKQAIKHHRLPFVTVDGIYEEIQSLVMNNNLESPLKDKDFFHAILYDLLLTVSSLPRTITASILLDKVTKDHQLSAYYQKTCEILLKNSGEGDEFFTRLAELFDRFQQYETHDSQMKESNGGRINSKHTNHKIFLEIGELCENYAANSPDTNSYNFFKRLLVYLQSFSCLFYIEQNTTEIVTQGGIISYFPLLTHNRSELIGKLLFELHLNPVEFERFFGKLKLDFLYHIAANCFPTINLHVDENLTVDALYSDNLLYTPNVNILKYIQKRNWLLAFILNEIYSIEVIPTALYHRQQEQNSQQHQINDFRLRPFMNYQSLSKICHLKGLFDGNRTVAALQHFLSAVTLKLYFEECIVKPDLQSIDGDNNISDAIEDIETSEEAVETNWRQLYNILNSLPERQLLKQSSVEWSVLRDTCATNLLGSADDQKDCHQLIASFHDAASRIDAILANLQCWSDVFVQALIQCECSRFDGNAADSQKLSHWLPTIQFCRTIAKIFDNTKSWFQCYQMCCAEPGGFLQLIIQQQCQMQDLLYFIKTFHPKDSILRTHLTSGYLFTQLEINNSHANQMQFVLELLDLLPRNHSIDLCHDLLKRITNMAQMNHLVEYCRSICDGRIADLITRYENSLGILACLPLCEQERLSHLLMSPLSIVEVLLMNMKLDCLATIFNKPQCDALRCSIDALLREYAVKSLDWTGALMMSQDASSSCSRLLSQTLEQKLLQSFDSIQFTESMGAATFVMPVQVPDKTKWIRNSEIRECMCCDSVGFSMFNRRHHCRRCGRLICAACSRKRMLVENYGSIRVRVCNDCYSQTVYSTDHSSEQCSVAAGDYWLLTNDAEHDAIVREEFSYENTPNIWLCLSILQYHSNKHSSLEYRQFLMDQCDHLLHLLLLLQSVAPQLDHTLVLQMLNTLLTALKLICPEDGSVEQLAAHIDLAQLLADSNLLELLPATLNAASLRHLCDRLLFAEEWQLALQVCIKAGADTNGVFAAWGRNCLKAGCYRLAREKFHKCFTESILTESMQLDLGATEPPLLQEIVRFLEREQCTRPTQPLLREIINGGDNDDEQHKSAEALLDPTIYEECIYYLTTYGTVSSLLQFYVNHGEIENVLNTLRQNRRRSAECRHHFIQVYLRCVRFEGATQKLFAHIERNVRDWLDALLALCAHLEQHKLLHCLLQVQHFLGDYVRASMTFVRLYYEEVPAHSFCQLAANVAYLNRAEQYLVQTMEAAAHHGNGPAEWVDLNRDVVDDDHHVMRLTPDTIQHHLKTVRLQRRIAANLAVSADCNYYGAISKVPTLFGTTADRQHLIVLLLMSDNIGSDQFELSVTIVEHFQLKACTVYGEAGSQLVECKLYGRLQQLVSAIYSWRDFKQDANLLACLDDIVIAAVERINREVPLPVVNGDSSVKVVDLIKLIRNRNAKISAYIDAKQLKTAYFLAVKYRQFSMIKRIKHEAQSLQLHSVETLCVKYLEQNDNEHKS